MSACRQLLPTIQQLWHRHSTTSLKSEFFFQNKLNNVWKCELPRDLVTFVIQVSRIAQVQRVTKTLRRCINSMTCYLNAKLLLVNIRSAIESCCMGNWRLLRTRTMSRIKALLSLVVISNALTISGSMHESELYCLSDLPGRQLDCITNQTSVKTKIYSRRATVRRS